MDQAGTCTAEDHRAPLIAGRYRLGPLLGADRRRRVHQAWDSVLHRAVAVLLVAPAPGSDPAPERPVLPVPVRPHLPGLAELYDGGAQDGVLFLVTQLVPGPTLRSWWRDGVAWHEATELGAEIAEVLVPVHRHGVAHGALGPDRILLAGPRLVITEYGLAPVIERWSGVRPDRHLLPPEQREGGAATPASDVYALGRLIEGARGTGRRHRPPRAVRELTRRMTAPDPRDRPGTEEVAATLAGFTARALATPVRASSGRGLRAATLLAAASVALGATAALAIDRRVEGAHALVATAAPLPPPGTVRATAPGSMTRPDDRGRAVLAVTARAPTTRSGGPSASPVDRGEEPPGSSSRSASPTTRAEPRPEATDEGGEPREATTHRTSAPWPSSPDPSSPSSEPSGSPTAGSASSFVPDDSGDAGPGAVDGSA